MKKILLAALLWSGPVLAQETAWTVRVQPQSVASSKPGQTNYSNAFLAFSLAESGTPALRGQAQQLVAPYLSWLQDYPRLQEVHGQREPAWVHGEADQVALVTLALIELDRANPDARRREQINQFAQGLAQLHHPNLQNYPFGAHTSFDPARLDSPAYAPGADAKAPGALWRPERSYQVKALAAASQYLGDKNLLEEAQVEAMGIWSHLATSGRWIWAFVPRPTGRSEILGPAAAVDNFLTLESITHSDAYKLLAGLSARDCLNAAARSADEKAAQDWVRSHTKGNRYLDFKNAAEPVSYQIMEAEKGKAVKQAFDEIDVTYPDGEAGKMVKVGRDQMFWMRFDIEREDDYFFHLIFLKSRLEGGLVSVMMRIDGDKIFQVNLGGASDPYVDMDFVDGPRPLRAGPHSFGIRFAGLLMTQPAILDAVLAWPVVERRFLSQGKRRLLVLHNLSKQTARTTYPEVHHWPPENISCVDGSGQPARLERQTDKRRHKEYLVLPPGGLAWLEWQEEN
ncbi:MAG: hypothetical protein KF760_01205 [Candidatus Eremiobacteraeota bacterium]|nr:hypothetical protein [Candidatus Eremiobacteraeota bacterium]MCW5868057.1 hypothetical protein [Candidatus Eremiobacteraeota bacterium]